MSQNRIAATSDAGFFISALSFSCSGYTDRVHWSQPQVKRRTGRVLPRATIQE